MFMFCLFDFVNDNAVIHKCLSKRFSASGSITCYDEDECVRRDLQSYHSHLSLFLPSQTGKFYILVDNRPWLQGLVSRPTHWWQLMVTKVPVYVPQIELDLDVYKIITLEIVQSRLSPFANTRGRKGKKSELSELRDSQSFRNRFWFTEAVLSSRRRALLPVKTLIANSKLDRTLYGFIVFEVGWDDVRGIKYLNELQTDTSFAIEAKVMQRWEFESVAQAAMSIPLWFPGTLDEQILLKEHLDATEEEVYHDAHDSFPETKSFDTEDTSDANGSPRSPAHTFSINLDTTKNSTPPSSDKPYKKGKGMRPIELLLQTSYPNDPDETLDPTVYRDVLILFRFNDRGLPFKLKDIIMSKLRLLTLLESGLPSWVIFLQSYPGFCRLYRPWMCPLAKGVYVLISVATVLIGFYDLYKNVPLLKATVSNLFGPLFDWVEEWEMISRIRYLGTMLFLHNFKKAVKGFLMVARSVFTFASFFLRPMAEPFFKFLDLFFPLWMMFVRLVDSSFSIVWMLVGDFVEILLLPLWYTIMLAWNVASSFVYPILWVLLYAPFKLVLALYSLVSFLGTSIYDLFDDVWISARRVFQLTKEVNKAVSSVEVSMWRSLWKDLFSQLFKALRSILNGFVAFFAACNRHRLSIYNRVVEFTRSLLQATRNAEKIQTEESRVKSKSIAGKSLERDNSPVQHLKTM